MFNVVIEILVIASVITSCVFGSITDFSEDDVKDQENIVFNSSFEQGSDLEEMPKGWISLEGNNEFLFWDDKYIHQGNKSLRVENPEENINIVSDAFPINPQFVYYTRCFIKTNYQSNHQVYLRFLGFNEKGKQVSKFSKKVYPETDWTKAELTSGFFYSTARFGRIVISIPDKDDKTYWIDDVESYKVYKIQK